ncbi:MAG: hypothetical protein R6V19_17510 [Armatimonadota bacterium]
MDDKFRTYQESGRKAAQYQISYLQDDGCYIWDGYADDAYHKQAYSWAVAGYIEEAHRLLTWVKDNTLRPDGELEAYNGDCYKYSWFFQGAHRLGRFDLSYPVMNFVLSCQAPCGGLPHFAGDKYLRSLATCWTGVSAIYFGQLDAAQRAAEWAISVFQQQPEDDHFYFQTTRDGRLVTPDMDAEGALCVDIRERKQDYWEVALPLQLLCRLYQATGIERYREWAGKFFEFNLKCADDAFSFVGSGKSSLGAALYYLISGDERAREGAIEFCDFLVETQTEKGGWRDPEYGEPDELLIYIDHAAEFNVWLHEVSSIIPAADERWA